MTTIIIGSFPRCMLHTHPADQWRILRNGQYFWAEQWVDVNKMTPSERTEYEANEETWAGFVAANGDPDEGRQEAPAFLTEDLARQWARVSDAEESISQDLAAFGAPGECYEPAHRSSNAEREAIWAQRVPAPADLFNDDRHRVETPDGPYNVAFLGAQPPKSGMDY